MSLSLSVLSQSGPPKSIGLKLDEKSIENGLEGQKFLVVCLFWGGCHHPNNGVIDSAKNYVEYTSAREVCCFFPDSCFLLRAMRIY